MSEISLIASRVVASPQSESWLADGEALFASSFVALDEVILRLDELVELFTQLWLNSAAEGAQAEAMTSARGAGVLVGADREGSIPAK